MDTAATPVALRQIQDQAAPRARSAWLFFSRRAAPHCAGLKAKANTKNTFTQGRPQRTNRAPHKSRMALTAGMWPLQELFAFARAKLLQARLGSATWP